MSRAGWVLVGGQSSRMGRDKALLPYRGRTLAGHIAAVVAAAAGTVTLVGNSHRFKIPGYEMISDNHTGSGPLGGIEAALTASAADWNLIVACDMPRLAAPFLTGLLEEAERCGGDCLVPVSPSGRLEPLCAVYGRQCLPAVRDALASGVRKLGLALGGVRLVRHSVGEPEWFDNLNTPEDWTDHVRTLSGGGEEWE